jgi:hypothetical protein
MTRPWEIRASQAWGRKVCDCSLATCRVEPRARSPSPTQNKRQDGLATACPIGLSVRLVRSLRHRVSSAGIIPCAAVPRPGVGLEGCIRQYVARRAVALVDFEVVGRLHRPTASNPPYLPRRVQQDSGCIQPGERACALAFGHHIP